MRLVFFICLRSPELNYTAISSQADGKRQVIIVWLPKSLSSDISWYLSILRYSKPCIIIFPNLPMPGRQRWQNLIQEQISLSQLSAQRKPLHLLYRSLSNYHMSEYFQPLDNKVGAKTADCYAARAECNIGQTFSICKRAGTNQASSQKDLSDCRMTSMNNLRSDAREHHWSLYSVLTCSLWKTLFL